MNFLQRNNNFQSRNNRKKKSPLPIAIIIFLIIIFSFSWTRGLIFNIVSPLWKTRNIISVFVTDNAQVFQSKSSLIAENNSLKSELAGLAQDKILMDQIKGENEDLKNILNRKGLKEKEILAAILIKPFLSPYDTLIIDIGSTDGVSDGDEVLADGNTHIGYISDVYKNSSKVTLYSSPGEKVKVLIGKDAILKEASGLGGGNFSVDMPREAGIQEGDTITIPSISSNIFSVVQKIVYKDTDSFEKVYFTSPVNISELRWVEVIPSVIKKS